MMTTKAQAIETLDVLECSIGDLPGPDPRVIERKVDELRAYIEQSQSVPEKISKYPGHVPPEDGEAGSYYVEGWNDCVDEMLAAVLMKGDCHEGPEDEQ